MCSLTLNNETFNLIYFNHFTQIKEYLRESYITFTIKNINNAYNIIDSLINTPITTFIVINEEDETIYSLNNINARIDTVNSYLSEGTVNIDITLKIE